MSELTPMKVCREFGRGVSFICTKTARQWTPKKCVIRGCGTKRVVTRKMIKYVRPEWNQS